MTLTRLPDWPVRYGAFVAARHGVAFAWGSNDCVLFAADFIQAFTGTDLAADFRGRYSDAVGAMRLIRSEGGLAEAVQARLGVPLPGVFARIGDLVLLDMAGREALGVCNGCELLGPGAHGIQPQPLSAAVMAWRI